MNIFLKYLLKSSFSKKGRSILLILTISLSTALLIGSIGAMKSASSTYKEEARRAYNDNDVLITANSTSKLPFFDKDEILKKEFERYIPTITASGYLKSDENASVLLTGIPSGDYSKLPNFKILGENSMEPFNGNKIIISQKVSKDFTFKLGDTVKLIVRGEEKSFNVAAIVDTSGPFLKDSKRKFTIITNEKNVSEIWGVDNLYSSLIVKLNNGIDQKTFVNNFNEEFTNCTAKLVYDTGDIERIADQLGTFFFFMLLLVIVMSVFIIYSCFKLIVLERIPVAGTFLSQGETMGGIIKLLIGESLLYAIISGIIAMFFGAGIVYLLAYALNDLKEYGIPTVPAYERGDFIFGFVFAILISTISALIPILGLRKMQVKDVILNTIGTTNKKSYLFPILGVLVATAAIGINFLNGSTAVNFSPLSFFMFLIGAVLALPGMVNIIAVPLMYIFGNISELFRLAINNIRTSKVLMNNIRLLTISMVSIMLIASISFSITSAFLDISKDLDFDVSVEQGSDPERTEAFINNNADVEKIIRSYDFEGAEIAGTEEKINIKGIEPDLYKECNNYLLFENKDELYEKLSKDEKNIALSEITAKKLKKTKGDNITLNIDNKKAEYTIIGTFNARLYNNGDINLINYEQMVKDFGISIPSQYMLQVKGSQDIVKKDLETNLKGTMAVTKTKDETIQENIDNNKILLALLFFFAVMTILLGGLGILNNIAVSFIQRKKEFAILASVGMTGMDTSVMALLEGLFTGVFASVIGGAISYVAVWIANNLFKLIGLEFPLMYDYKVFCMISSVILGIMVITSFKTVLKSSKLSVAQELKYE